MGADVLLWPARSWGGQARIGAPRTRAQENCVPVIHVDGWHEDANCHAIISDHHGEIAAECISPNETMSAVVHPADARQRRTHGYSCNALFRVRRTELYGPLQLSAEEVLADSVSTSS